MTRREEVEEMCKDVQFFDFAMGLATDLADEVDARDAIIDKLLAMLEPDYSNNELYRENKHVERLHARACEIAGRVK